MGREDIPPENGLILRVASGELQYRVHLDTISVEIPEMYRIQHFFRDIDIEEIQRQKKGLVVEMLFDEHILESFHTQLKIISGLLPNCLAALDHSSRKSSPENGSSSPQSQTYRPHQDISLPYRPCPAIPTRYGSTAME